MPYDWDEYAQTFFPKAEELVNIAQAAEQEGNTAKAAEYYLQVAAVLKAHSSLSKLTLPGELRRFTEYHDFPLLVAQSRIMLGSKARRLQPKA